MGQFASNLSSILRVALLAAALLVLIFHVSALNTAIDDLLAMTSRVRTIEAMSVKVAFDPETVVATLDFAHLRGQTHYKKGVSEEILKLAPSQFERLMNVGELSNLCDYSRPTAGMMEDMASDLHLGEDGFVTIRDDSETLAKLKKDIGDEERTSHRPSEIGYPTSCYKMTMTSLGHDVKTAVVRTLSPIFNARVASK